MKYKNGFLVACLLSIVAPAYGATVSRIDVTGNMRMDAESVRILGEVKIGDNVGTQRANEIAKKLQASGYFSKINVRMSGNVLKIDVAEAPTINMVTIEGNDEISTDDLKKEITIEKFAIIKVGYFASEATWLRTQKELWIEWDEAIQNAQERAVKEDTDFVMLTRICPNLSKDTDFINPEACGHYNNSAMEIIGTEAGNALANLSH